MHSGARVFDKYKVEALRKDCFPAPLRGEIEGYRPSGPESLKGLHFVPDASGGLQIWEDRVLPCPGNLFKDRYLTVVDIGGRSMKSDWSVIVVFDRNGMGRGRKPRVVAQWRGHTDIDLLAWNAARIAAYYCKSLLVMKQHARNPRSRPLYGRRPIAIHSQSDSRCLPPTSTPAAPRKTTSCAESR